MLLYIIITWKYDICVTFVPVSFPPLLTPTSYSSPLLTLLPSSLSLTTPSLRLSPSCSSLSTSQGIFDVLAEISSKSKALVLDWSFHITKLFNCFAAVLAHPPTETYTDRTTSCLSRASSTRICCLVPHEKLDNNAMNRHLIMGSSWCILLCMLKYHCIEHQTYIGTEYMCVCCACEWVRAHDCHNVRDVPKSFWNWG